MTDHALTESAPDGATTPDPGTSIWAIVSLVGIIVPIVGIVAGHIGLVQTGPGRQAGRRFAIAGLVIGYTTVFMTIVTLLVIWSLLPGLEQFLEDLPAE